MACFITPLVVGLVVYALSSKQGIVRASPGLRALAVMLLGGALLLALEHAWHGEVVPYPPFLTAAMGPQGLATMLRELAIVGGSITVATMTLWAGIAALANRFELARTLLLVGREVRGAGTSAVRSS